MSYVTFTLILLAVAVGAKQRPLLKVIGGTPAREGEFPYQVSLRVNGKHFCGGVIIGEQHILTAAHCVDKFLKPPYDNAFIVTGTNSLSRDGARHLIKRAVIHPKFENDLYISLPNDVAVITLLNPMTFNDNQKPVKLASKKSYNGLPAVVIGWSRSKLINGTLSKNLTKLSTKVLDFPHCRDKMPQPVILYENQICSVSPLGKGLCKGDSGGPLIVDEEVVGILSFGLSCALGYPVAYTSVFPQIKFINEEMRP